MPVSRKNPLRLLVLVLALCLTGGGASAGGEIGDHVKNLKAHIGEYEQDVAGFLKRVDGLVKTYAAEGARAVDGGKLIDWWEDDLRFHAAIETQYPPLYAAIWQGIYGVKQAVENGKPADQVRAQRDALARALWQGLGAVKLAASRQQAGGQALSRASAAMSGGETIDRIVKNLDSVVEKYRAGSAEPARDLVHSTYAQLFEGVEGTLIEHNAELVEDLEKDFNVTLPQLIQTGAPVGKVSDAVSAMRDKLAEARQILVKAEQDKKDVF